MDTGLLYRAVALNLWRWGGDPANEFEALRACDDLGLDPADPELRSEPVSQDRLDDFGLSRRSARRCLSASRISPGSAAARSLTAATSAP